MKTAFYVIIGAVVLLAVISIAFIVASGDYLPQQYREPWDKKYFQRFGDPRLKVVAHGILAANSHNMQAWKIRLDDQDKMSFLLYIDSDRLTPQVDIYSRQITISQGTFLEYARIAALKLGYSAEISLFPEGEFDSAGSVESIKSKSVARVTLKPGASIDSPLYDAMFLPDTSRVAYLKTQLTSDQARQLQSLNTDEQISLSTLQDKMDLDELGKLAMEGANVEAYVPRVAKETNDLFRVNEYQKNTFRYGFSLEGQGYQPFSIFLVQSLLSLFPSMNDEKTTTDAFLSSTKTEIENTPAYVLIITRDNSRTSQVKTGILYSRLMLTAQTMGLCMQPLSQVTEEYPEMRTLYDKIHKEYAEPGQTIQMLARIGKPAQEVLPSMRRDALELISK
jgi:hypothetical protein